MPLLRPFAAALLITLGGISVVQAKTPNDPNFLQQWHLRQINAEAAWEKTTGSDNVTVAVIDTGVDIEHEDIRENIWTNPGEIAGNGKDDDGNGYVDDIHGWNFLKQNADVRPSEVGIEEGFIHGTLVASLIGARGNNGVGVTGVAWRVRIMPLVALDPMGSGSADDVADAVRYAVLNGAHIINLSLEGYTESLDLSAALAYARSKGVLTVAAAGNSDGPAGNDLDVLRVYPACQSADPSFGLITVGGTDTMDQKSPSSNFGSCVNVTAPSYDLYGALPSASSPSAKYGGGYRGTSLAAPIVAGAAALLKAVHPDWRAEELKGRLMVSAQKIAAMDGVYAGKLGSGRIDLEAALKDMPPSNGPVASTSTASPVSPAPTVSPAAAMTLTATLPGTLTRVAVTGSGSSGLVLQPYGASDRRGARAVFFDVERDGTPEIFIVPASGSEFIWVLYGLDGTERRRGTVVRDIKEGMLLAAVRDGIVAAETGGGRVWGITDAFTPKLFYPFGIPYRGGLDLLAISGAAAFAPRGGGGHLMITDVNGRRLVSVFPFGTSARGRWSLARLPASANRPASLVMSGPLGSRYLDALKLGAAGWQAISFLELEKAQPVGSGGSVSGVANERVYDTWRQ